MLPMSAETHVSATAELLDLSLVRGGPLYRAQEATRLIRPNQWNHVRRVTFAIAVGWIPLIVITAISHRDALVSLLLDYRVHSRLLIAVPALMLGQAFLEARFRMVIHQIGEANLLGAGDRIRMNRMIDNLRFLRDSWLPEMTIMLLVIIHTFLSYKGQIDAMPWLAYGSQSNLHPTIAGWYAILVSAAIFFSSCSA